MSIYGVAFVDRHGNVGHWITGSGRDSDHVIPIIVVNIFIWFCFLLVGGLTTQAQRPGPKDAWIATGAPLVGFAAARG